MSSDLEKAKNDALDEIKDLEASEPALMVEDFEQAKSDVAKAKTPGEVKKIVAALKEKVNANKANKVFKGTLQKRRDKQTPPTSTPPKRKNG